MPHGQLFEDKLDEWIANQPITAVLKRLSELNIASAKVLTIPELEGNPQYVARESITQWKTMSGETCKDQISCRNSKIIQEKSGVVCLLTAWIPMRF